MLSGRVMMSGQSSWYPDHLNWLNAHLGSHGQQSCNTSSFPLNHTKWPVYPARAVSCVSSLESLRAYRTNNNGC